MLLLTCRRWSVDAGKWERRALSHCLVWTGYGPRTYGPRQQELISVGFNVVVLLITTAFSS